MPDASALPRPGAADPPRAARLGAAFGALVAACFALVVLGALVRAHGAGLSCPDWPLCFGQAIPRFNLEVAFEWTHRLVAGSVSLAFAVLAALALRGRDTRAVAPLLAVAASLLATQVLLGALTVWKLLAPWTVTAHLLTGNAFAATLLLTSLSLHERAAPAPRAPVRAAARRATALSALLLALQLALGGLVASRYAGLACLEWPTCQDGVWFPSWQGAMGLQLLHRLNGYALVASLAALAWLARAQPPLRRLAALALGLGLAQVAAGVANVLLRVPVEITGLHSALAAALVLTLAATARRAWLGRPAA